MAIDDQTIEAAAGRWLARRDRGLTPVEQDAFLQWLRDDPKHSAAFARMEQTWSALGSTTAWRLAAAAAPASRGDRSASRLSPRARIRILTTAIAAAAAAMAAGLYFGLLRPESTPGPSTPGIVRHEPDRMTLPDGSVVDLNASARVEVAFVPAERLVRLVSGEAVLNVAKDPGRPFVVHAGRVAIRAVGTAFNVQLAEDRVDVFVTEGRVRLGWSGRDIEPAIGRVLDNAPELGAGEQAVIDLGGASPALVVGRVGADEAERLLSWQRPYLEFDDLPLSDVVAEFNRHNTRQLVVRDGVTAALRVGGTFRADNVDGFVRLLEASFGVEAERLDESTTLLRKNR